MRDLTPADIAHADQSHAGIKEWITCALAEAPPPAGGTDAWLVYTRALIDSLKSSTSCAHEAVSVATGAAAEAVIQLGATRAEQAALAARIEALLDARDRARRERDRALAALHRLPSWIRRHLGAP